MAWVEVANLATKPFVQNAIDEALAVETITGYIAPEPLGVFDESFAPQFILTRTGRVVTLEIRDSQNSNNLRVVEGQFFRSGAEEPAFGAELLPSDGKNLVAPVIPVSSIPRTLTYAQMKNPNNFTGQAKVYLPPGSESPAVSLEIPPNWVGIGIGVEAFGCFATFTWILQ